MRGEVDRVDESSLSEPDAITLGCLRENLAQELRHLDARLIEHTVSAMPFSGPAVLLATMARTVLVDAQAAENYLERLRGGGTWIDQQSERRVPGHAVEREPDLPRG